MTKKITSPKHINNLIERTLMIKPDADVDLVRLVAPVLNDMERSRLEQKIQNTRAKLNKKKEG